MWFGSREDQVRQLEGEAYDALERGEWDAAEAIASKLLAMQWSGGFEIAALAAQGRGDLARAASVLEEGVEKVPSVGSLWHLLGVVRSDLGRFEGALEAFDRALACEGSDAMSVRFNRAIVQKRRGEPGAALDDLELILGLPKPPPFAEEALSLAVACLASIGRARDGLTMVRAAYDASSEHDPRRARLAAELAIALDLAGEGDGERDARFEEATASGVATPALLALGRRLHPIAARSPRMHHVILTAPAIDPSAAGMMRVFHVCAGDLAQALEAARRYLPEPVRAAAALEEHEDRGPSGDEPGVHWASGIIHFGDG